MDPRHEGEEGRFGKPENPGFSGSAFPQLRSTLAGMSSEERYIAVYIMASDRLETLYIGATGYLARRAWEHREGLIPGFTKKYGLKRLVWHEPHDDMATAFQREKSLKRWPRQWKINLIERTNPFWDDLYPGLA